MTDPATLPPAPRTITPRGRNRAWAEAPVRLWLLLAIVVCGVTAYLFYDRISVGLQERSLINNGVKVDASIDEIEGQNRVGVRAAHSAAPHVRMRYTYEGVEYPVDGNLSRVLEGEVVVGRPLPLRIDPKKPRIWTDRIEPRPWVGNLSMPLIFLPVAILTLVVLLWQRQRVLNVWRNGVPAVASVVSVQQSALAPRSRLLRYAIRDSEDRRVFTLLYPVHAGVPQKGDELDLVILPDNPARAVVAKLYM
jgi:hypothetical protein